MRQLLGQKEAYHNDQPGQKPTGAGLEIGFDILHILSSTFLQRLIARRPAELNRMISPALKITDLPHRKYSNGSCPDTKQNILQGCARPFHEQPNDHAHPKEAER